MIPEDSILWKCNESELLHLARSQGIGLLKPGIPQEELVAIVGGYAPPRPEHFSTSQYTRQKLEALILQNWGRLASQLPGCTGRCTTYPCTEGKHAACFFPNRRLVQ